MLQALNAVYKFKRYEDSSLVYTGLESKHAGESIGLFDTVLSPEEYASLYSTQQSSMSGLGYENSEIPSFTAAVSMADDDEDDEPPIPAKKAKIADDPLAIKKPVVSAPVSRPITPAAKPAAPAVSPKPTVAEKVDISGVALGSKLTHKAFGAGVVKALDNQYIVVDFNGTEKKFMFPAAILQGFLKITE